MLLYQSMTVLHCYVINLYNDGKGIYMHFLKLDN